MTRAPSKPGPAFTPAPRHNRVKPLAELVRPTLAGALEAHGLAAADLLAHWPEIAGERLARHAVPVRLVRARATKDGAERQAQPATLLLQVDGAFAWEVEMAQAQIVERINAVYGWRCVGKLRLRQGPVAAPTRPVPTIAKLPDTQAAALRHELGGIEEEPLRASLERLGEAVLGRRRPGAATRPKAG